MVKNRRGFTLVELMIVVAVVGIIAMMAPTILTNTTRFFILGKTKLQLQEEARSAMFVVSRQIHQAQASTIVIDQLTGQPYYSRIKFTTIENVPTAIWQNGTNLYMTTANSNQTTTLTSNLAYVAFTFPATDDMTIISFSMTLQKQIYGGLYKALHMASEHIQVMNS